MNDGIYDNISIEDYHANKSHVSATTLKYAKTSLKHFDWYRRGLLPREEKSQFHFGNAFELALLGGDEYTQKVAVFPDAELIEKALEADKELKKPRSSK